MKEMQSQAIDLRCLLFDLDGTLLRSDKTISPRTLQALEDCRKRGIQIGICTNRGENRAQPFAELLKPDVVISSGGALVRYKGKVIFQAEFSPAETRRVLDLIRRICGPDREITMDTADAHYWNFKTDPAILDKSWTGSTYCDFAHYTGSALKISAEITDDTFLALKAALPDCDCLRHAGEDWCKITRRDATKENALRELERVSGLRLETIAAFGDDAPDIGMLRLCGLGVAMGNAIPEVKSAADLVIGTNDEDGIAEWLEAAIFEDIQNCEVNAVTEINLIEPCPDVAEDLWAFRQEVLDNDSDNDDQFAGCMSLDSCSSAEEWIKLCRLRKSEQTCGKAGTAVPSHTFLAIRQSDRKIVGIIDLRHHIDHPILGTWGGHCGYTVRPSERRKGYAKEMLRLNILKAKELGIGKLLVTCNPSNAASEKTILANGGVYEKSIDVDGHEVKRYWISVT